MDHITYHVQGSKLKREAKIKQIINDLEIFSAKNRMRFDWEKKWHVINFKCSKSQQIEYIKIPNNITRQQEDIVKLLGIWIDSQLNINFHLIKLKSKIIPITSQLSKISYNHNGTSSRNIFQLFQSCITTILNYGALIYRRNMRQTHLNNLQIEINPILRSALYLPKMTPTEILRIESATPPVNHIINRSKTMQIFSSIPESNHQTRLYILSYTSFK